MGYTLDLLRAGLRLPHKRTHALVARDFVGWVRTEFLGAAARAGLLTALAQPRTEQELAARLRVTEPGMLSSLLEVGAAVGELRKRRDLWSLRGARAKALADPAVDGLTAIVEEAVVYDADAYQALERRLRGEPPGDYLAKHAKAVARASRVVEPLLAALTRDVVRRLRPANVLDVGCGSGAYLRHAAGAAPRVTGAGIDVEPDVVEVARSNLEEWGLAGRFAVHHADVRDLPPELAGPWDLVLLFQNLYYFPRCGWPDLMGRLRALTPAGAVAIAACVAGTSDPCAAHFDLMLRSTAGTHPLPTAPAVEDALTAAGFRTVERRRLAPGQPLRAFLAH